MTRLERLRGLVLAVRAERDSDAARIADDIAALVGVVDAAQAVVASAADNDGFADVEDWTALDAALAVVGEEAT